LLIIPAIDLRGGRCVRLTQGDYGRETIYDLDPVEVAQRFAAEGAEIVHVVDLDGAKSGSPQNLEIVARIAAEGGLPVEFGGGVRTLETAHRALEAGVQRVVVGSKLVQDAELSARFFAELGDRVVAGIDAREGKVATIGWTETSEVTAVELALRVEAAGCRRIILTDIARDGELKGPNLELLRDVVSAVKIPVIASGGVAVVEDLVQLREAFPAGVEGAIVGKAIYENRFTVAQAVAALAG
jgi:phosphoribosylformimino-5-aminoimidazole carboxamide ribotide isomerase